MYTDIHFEQIQVSGFRGRNFTLKMNPRGNHTVFIMDGNTGKTTIIELLRWCFIYKESESDGNFEHMYINPAHVLDHNKQGKQICYVEIIFTAFDEDDKECVFRYKREIKGEYISGYKKTGDKIDNIKDILDINNGEQLFNGDDAYDLINDLFSFRQCAEYFCFDGEKAREVMQLTSNAKKMEQLLTLINTRVTSKRMQSLKQSLKQIRGRVYSAAKSKMTDTAISRNENDLNYFLGIQENINKEISNIQSNIEAYEFNITQTQEQHDKLEKELLATQQENLVLRIQYDNNLNTLKKEIKNKRSEIYKYSLTWIQLNSEILDMMNDIKEDIKETGNLPEPYREDLINLSLKNKICHICGRKLDDKSMEHIMNLGLQIATDDVHQFLSNEINFMDLKEDPMEFQLNINNLFDNIEEINIKIQSLNLTEEDEIKINQKEALKRRIISYEEQKDKLLETKAVKKSNLNEINQEVKRLEKRLDIIQENRIILDKINDSLESIDLAEENIKLKVINIISKVISDGVTSILGPKFSAKLSKEDGLMLGEDSHYGVDRGGYSGRLILSYCFAEAMTLIDPIIIDTPSGNIGSHREALAEHLAENHSQVILLCLPTEIQNFAPIIDDNPIEIKNEEGST